MDSDQRRMLEQVEHYREVVLAYEAIDQEIDDLIMAFGGLMENMPSDVLLRYRELARRRDELLNEMRALEHELQIDDDA